MREQLQQGEWVLVVSNRFWFHYVYLFSLSIKVFQKLLRLHHSDYNHALRVKDGYTIEMLGNGRNVEPVEQWIRKQRRKVIVLKPKQPFKEVEAMPYGYADIVQIVLHYLRKNVLKRGNSWNGKDGVKRWPGYFCSEEVSLACGMEKAYLSLPCQIPGFDCLEVVGTFET